MLSALRAGVADCKYLRCATLMEIYGDHALLSRCALRFASFQLRNHTVYSPILVLTTLDLTNFLDLANGEKLSLKTDLKNVPGVLPGAPGVSEILNLTKSSI